MMKYAIFFSNRNYQTMNGEPCTIEEHLIEVRDQMATPDAFQCYEEEEIIDLGYNARIMEDNGDQVTIADIEEGRVIV